MRLAVVCLLLSGCGPVLLGEEQSAPIGAAGSTSQVATPTDASTQRDAPALPSVAVHIKPVDCGKCFDLQAEGSGGQSPYTFEWEDGSVRAQRMVCVDGAAVTLLVIAKDVAGVRSAPQAIQLQRASEAACPQPAQPAKPAPRPTLCLKNPSFEGTPAANFGQEQAFDAAPWSTCTNPEATNTPDVGNDTVAQTLGVIPKPTQGDTFLALGEGEQVSQAFCSPLPEDAPVYLQLDLTRMNIGAGLIPETEQVFLEIWGGLSVDCSRRELLWASPPLEPNWKTFCVPLRPPAFLTQLTLRAGADMSLPSPAYLLVDNLKSVEACP